MKGSALFQFGFKRRKKEAAQRFSQFLSNAPSLYTRKSYSEDANVCALRIIYGLHQGAALKIKDPIRLGSAADNDMVLQDPGVRPHHAELRRVDGVWGLFDLESGRALQAIETLRRGKFERRRHGLGAAELVFSQFKRRRGSSKLVQHSNPKRALAVLLLVLSVLLTGLAVSLGTRVFFPEPLEESRSLIREGFPDVKLITARNTQPRLIGYVDNEAALTGLKRWLNQQTSLQEPLLKVRVGEELAARVREALQSTQLTVQYISGGVVRLSGTTSDLDVREQIARLAADLRGVIRIDDNMSYIEPVEEVNISPYKMPVPVVGLIPGIQGSFGDGRGRRYFVGAVLPDGAQVVRIGPDVIEVSVAGSNKIVFLAKP